MQRKLMRWQKDWDGLWADDGRRQAAAEQAGIWSEKVLEFSGLLDS